MKPYLLDSNFFIQAHRVGNPLDVAESFWKKVKQLADAGKIISLDKVKKEIFGKEDDLKKWCEANLPNDFFMDSATVLSAYIRITQWANSKKGNPYNQEALDVFNHADEADAWLVAFALTNQYAVVTNEISAPGSKKIVKIPDVCDAFQVRYLNPIQMFRELGERY